MDIFANSMAASKYLQGQFRLAKKGMRRETEQLKMSQEGHIRLI